ncbi:MAG: cardiolipin synthase [Planctomycetota bacterium]|nr:cardiolipin synthase [Planctomycetota bacterium]
MLDHWTLALLLIALETAGVVSVLHVLMRGPTPQGVLAWSFFLLVLPIFAVPLYWIFGPHKYDGYIDARRTTAAPFHGVVETLREEAVPMIVERDEEAPLIVALERLVRLPLTSGNRAELLVDGDATRAAIFEAIDAARQTVLLQFFIVRDDGFGQGLSARLEAARARGVRVCFIYDEIGSHGLTRRFIRRLRSAGVQIQPFGASRRSHRFQLNFRNHRKVVVIDGALGFVGGLNIGDEYLGLDPELSPWRDTFVRVRGPVVAALQLSFLEDWHWATDQVPDWPWPVLAAPDATEDGRAGHAIALPTGPADPFETCSLAFVALIDAAEDRLWIATPYFVFDAQIMAALQLAALRGVDVRVLVPERADHAMAYYAGWSYHSRVLESGCRIFRYTNGFMHQKVLLVDDRWAMVGTKNLDNRSMRLNFEISLLVECPVFAGEVEDMLQRDFEASGEVTRERLAGLSPWFRLKSRAARLFAPIL